MKKIEKQFHQENPKNSGNKSKIEDDLGCASYKTVGCQIGKPALITCDQWFFAPDGKTYQGVWGTIKAVHDSENVLGVRTNAKSTNWYIEIGNMIIAGCQVHYIIACDHCNFESVNDASWGNEGIKKYHRPSAIFNADLFSSEIKCRKKKKTQKV